MNHEPMPVPTPTNQEIEDMLRRDVVSAPPGSDRTSAVGALLAFLEAKSKSLLG